MTEPPNTDRYDQFVALFARNERAVHLSDSVSVIDLRRGVVVETVQVGDRPGDVVFAGQGGLAFVSSMNEQSVYVIDVITRKIKKRISIPAHSPRSLLASSDGTTVWVASYLSGNGTTVIPHTAAPAPPTPTNSELPDPPRQGIIVSANDPRWKRQIGVELKDEDIFEIDVETLDIRRSFAGVGTALFNLAQHPKSREQWVANTEARNLVRFEPQLNGHVVDNRISRIDVVGTSDSPMSITDLNPHIDYEQLPSTVGLETAIAQPTDIVFNPTGDKAFVASFGTDRIGVLDEAGNVLTRIELHDAPAANTDPRNKRGPRSLAMHRNGTAQAVHPMKGPLVTQTLRGLAGEKLFHWRADRPGLESFNRTFEHLMGGEQLTDDDLAVFVDYLQSIHFGPNPHRNRDDSLTANPTGMSARDGERIFMKRLDVGREGRNTFRCVDCHMRTNGAGATGFTGLIEQPTKVAQLRGLNERIPFTGDGTRIGGFGFGADGSKASLREFLADSHRFHGITEPDKAALESFLLSFPTETPAIVGFTRTVHVSNRNEESIQSDVALLIEQAQLGNCSLSVTGLLRGERIKLVYDRTSRFFRDRASGNDEIGLERVMSRIDNSESFVSFVASPLEVGD